MGGSAVCLGAPRQPEGGRHGISVHKHIFYLQAWTKLTGMAAKLAAVTRRGMLLRCLRAWRNYTVQSAAMRRRIAAAQARWAASTKRTWLLGWQAAAGRMAWLKDAEQQLAAATQQRALQAAWATSHAPAAAHSPTQPSTLCPALTGKL